MIRSTNGSRGIPGVSYTASGDFDFPGQVRAKNVALYPPMTLQRSSLQRLRGDGMRAVSHGSSTLANGSSYRVLGGTVGDRKQCTNSLIWALNAEGAEIDEIWNGAFAGDKTGEIHNKLLADWPTIKDSYDIHFYAPAFNNLTDPLDDLSAAKPLIISDLKRIAYAGKRITYILPFAGNPLSSVGVTHRKYTDYIAWAYATVESLQAYRGQILIWNLYEIFNAGGIDLPIQYAGETSTFRQHLNSKGVVYAARHPLSKDIVRSLQIPRFEGIDVYGTPVAALDMTTAVSAAGAVISSDGTDPDTGEPVWLITGTADLSSANSEPITVDPAKTYRIVGKYEIVSQRTMQSANYVDGIKWEDPIAQRIGIWPTIFGAVGPYTERPTGPVHVFGSKWRPADSGGTLRLFPGDPGAVVRVRGNKPIRLYEVPA